MRITLEKVRGAVAERPLLSPEILLPAGWSGALGPRLPRSKNGCGGAVRLPRFRPLGRVRTALAGDSGAVTAEYVIVVLAALAFGGLLLSLMRGGGLQDLLGSVIKNAINAFL